MKQLAWCNLVAGNAHLDAYLDYSPKLRPGVKVTLRNSEDPLNWWTVVSVGDPKPAELLERKENWYKTNFSRKEGVFQSDSWNKSS